MLRILDGDPDRKIRKLMDYTERGGDVADPWYTDRFDVTYRDIYDGCIALLETLEKSNNY
jgi:protein-tyrosine phosphatase